MAGDSLSGKRILLGVTGGIAAYKACELARMLVRDGASVQVVLTPNAAQFVTPLTFAGLTNQAAWVGEFADSVAAASSSRSAAQMPPPQAEFSVYPHLDLTRGIDCFVIAPATAGTLGKLAHGVADNLLTSAYVSCVAPVVIAPAMNVRMWEHPAVLENVATLRARGHVIVEPGSGELACGDVGGGRLAEVEAIAAAVLLSIAGSVAAASSRRDRHAEGIPTATNGGKLPPPQDESLSGLKVIISAGATREYLDPVRFITNNSTGMLGIELAEELAKHGGAVTLIHSGVTVPPCLGAKLAGEGQFQTAFDLQSAITRALPQADALVMLAAVADYGPTRYSSRKRKKDGAAWSLELAETPDVLASLAPLRQPGQLFIGVSLEDEDWLKRAQRKAAAKGCDAMLAVELTGELPYGDSRLHCALVSPDAVVEPPQMRSKAQAARMLADWLAANVTGVSPEANAAGSIEPAATPVRSV